MLAHMLHNMCNTASKGSSAAENSTLANYCGRGRERVIIALSAEIFGLPKAANIGNKHLAHRIRLHIESDSVQP